MSARASEPGPPSWLPVSREQSRLAGVLPPSGARARRWWSAAGGRSGVPVGIGGDARRACPTPLHARPGERGQASARGEAVRSGRWVPTAHRRFAHAVIVNGTVLGAPLVGVAVSW